MVFRDSYSANGHKGLVWGSVLHQVTYVLCKSIAEAKVAAAL